MFMKLPCVVGFLVVSLVCFPSYSQPQKTKTSPICKTESVDLEKALECLDNALIDERYEDAIDGFEEILKLEKTDTTPELRDRAMAGLVFAKIGLRKKKEGLWVAIWGRVSEFLLKYLILILGVTGLLLFPILMKAFPRGGTDVSFVSGI